MRRLMALLILMSAADCYSQSTLTVADIARRERQRQRGITSRIIISNTSTPAAPAQTPTPGTVPVAPGAAANAAGAAKPVGVTDSKGRDEKSWRAAFQVARDNVKRAEARLELLDLRIKDLNKQMLQLSSFYNREYRMGPELTAAQKDIEDARKDVELSKKTVADLEEELRRSGGPAGWSR
jgi:hypothetical protein